jgi:hypothetical protein
MADRKYRKEPWFQYPFYRQTPVTYIAPIRPYILKLHYLPIVPSTGDQAINIWAFDGHLKFKP